MLVTKKQAVDQLMDAGIEALERGWPLVAITLFGAAEEAMPRAEEPAIFQSLVDLFGKHMDGGNRAVASLLNQSRNWLKHTGGENQIEIPDYDCCLMFIRALNRFDLVYGEHHRTEIMKQFINGMLDKIKSSIKNLLALHLPL